MVICLERGAGLHMAQLMPLPLTVSCFSKIRIVFTFLVPAYLVSPGERAIKQFYVVTYLSAMFECGRQHMLCTSIWRLQYSPPILHPIVTFRCHCSLQSFKHCFFYVSVCSVDHPCNQKWKIVIETTLCLKKNKTPNSCP